MSELVNLEKKAITLHKCHNYNAGKYKTIENSLANSVLIFGLVLTSVIPLIDVELKYKETINTLIGLCITLLTAFSKSYKPGEKFEKHRYSSQEYISLKYKIRQQIIKSHPDDQRNIQEIEKVTMDFESLRKECPFISDTLYDKKYVDTIELLSLNTETQIPIDEI
jgi:hypothetical protein